MKLIHALALTATAISLVGCASPEKAATPPLTRAAVEKAVIAQVRSKSSAFPEATISFEMTEDWLVACGTISVPGKPPMVYYSPDSDPHDGERVVGMAPLRERETWDLPAAARLTEANRQLCQDNGLLK